MTTSVSSSSPGIDRALSLPYWVIHAAILFLLTVTAFEVRGSRISLGFLSFYWTTARIGILLMGVISFYWFLRYCLPILRKQYRDITTSILFFCAIATISSLASSHAGVALERILFYSCFFYFFGIALSLPYKKILEHVPLYLFVAGLVLGIMGCLQWWCPQLRKIMDNTFLIGTHSFIGRTSAGINASLQNSITYGCFMVIAFISMWILRWKMGLYLLIPAAPIILAGIILSCSRLAAIGFLVFSAAILVSSVKRVSFAKNWRHALICVAALVFFLVFTAQFRYVKVWQSVKQADSAFSSVEDFDRYSSHRLSLWSAALKMWTDNKWLGVGPGVYDKHLADYAQYKFLSAGFQHPHNLFLRIICETGVFGTIAFGILAYLIARKIFRCGIRYYTWPFMAFLFFEMLEEFTRDAFPSLIFVLITAYAIKAAQDDQVVFETSKTQIP
ncbi:O-antigen ligase family protein [Elusimicrobiota bacterium]